MATPTQLAEQKFKTALVHLGQQAGEIDNRSMNNDLLQALKNMNEGFIALSKGVRATYALLEEVNRKLSAGSGPGGGPFIASGRAGLGNR